jgi:dihydrofolate synthase / folylpolyglutamate synthase
MPSTPMPIEKKNSDAVLDRLMSLHPKVIDLILDRVTRLLARLGHPEDDLPPVIHVAGTNGKGSVIAYMQSALEAAGYSVHVYTSPHLVRFNERIRLAGDLIAEDALTAVLKECEEVNGGEPITYFEITTCAALLAFSRTPADVLILETGLGGRLDATNVLARPALTVITEVSIDHQQFLGESLEEIAGEKAGILKKGVPAVVARQQPAARDVILTRAAELGAPVIEEGTDWRVQAIAGGMTINAGGRDQYLPRPVLPGDHQLHNAGVAVKALETLPGFEVSGPALAQGLKMAQWPARFQHLVSGPLVDSLPDGWELWLDGGHNAAAAQIIVDEVTGWGEGGEGKPLHLIYGMLNSKDANAFLAPLAPVTKSLRSVTIPGEENAISAVELAEAACAAGHQASAASSVEEALKTIVGSERKEARVLICGSLYLAGDILVENA